MENSIITQVRGHITRIEGELEQLKEILNGLEAKASQAKKVEQTLLFHDEPGVKLLFDGSVSLPTLKDRKCGEFDLETLKWYCEKALNLAHPLGCNMNQTFKVNVTIRNNAIVIDATTYYNKFVGSIIEVSVEVSKLDKVDLKIYLYKGCCNRDKLYSIFGNYNAIQERRTSQIAKSSNACKMQKDELTVWREKGYRPVYSQGYGIYMMLSGDYLPTDTSRQKGEIDINFLQKILNKAMKVQDCYLEHEGETSNIFVVEVISNGSYAEQHVRAKQQLGKNHKDGRVVVDIRISDEDVRLGINVIFEDGIYYHSETFTEYASYSMLSRE